MRPMIPAYEFRRRAREAMKLCMPILLVVALIAALPSLIQQTVTLVTDANLSAPLNDLSNRLMQVMEKYGLTQPAMIGDVAVNSAQFSADVLTVYEQFFQDMQVFAQTKGPILLGLSLMVLILAPVLTLGLINALLHALRKQEFTVSIALSRVRYILKALGLELLVALKIVAWMLPGMALTFLSVLLPETLMILTMIAGSILMLVLGIMAGYRYAMVMFVLADEPETRLLACFRRSCEIMHRRKMELFSLELSFIGWYLLLSLARMLFFSFGQVIGMTLSMFASLFLTVYTNCAQAAFYQAYSAAPAQGGAPAPEEGAADV